MKMLKSALQEKLEKLRPGLSAKETIVQSNCFIFQSGQILTYNDEISVSVPFDADFSCAVPAAPLLNALSKYTADELEITVEGNELKMQCGRRKNGLKIFQDINIPLGALVQPETYVPLHPDFPLALSMVVNSCGTDQSKYVLTCVHVTPEAVEACDSYQATRYQLRTGLEDMLIPSTSARMLAKAHLAEAGVSNQWLFCRGQGLTYACRLFCNAYPELSPMFKQEGASIEFPKDMTEILNGASVFSDATQKAVNITIENGQMRVYAANDTGWFEEQTADIDYQDKLEISINPMFMATLLKHGSICTVAPFMLLVANENYKHITARVLSNG